MNIIARPGGCARCQAYALARPDVIDACAEVAEDKGLRIDAILERFLQRYHSHGHRLVDTT